MYYRFPSQSAFFIHVGTFFCLPRLNQYQAEHKTSCLRTLRSAPNEPSRNSSPLIPGLINTVPLSNCSLRLFKLILCIPVEIFSVMLGRFLGLDGFSWLSFVKLNCVFVTFPCGILGQVLYMIVSIPDLCHLSYFGPILNRGKSVLHKDTTQCLQRDTNQRPLYLKSSTLPLRKWLSLQINTDLLRCHSCQPAC